MPRLSKTRVNKGDEFRMLQEALVYQKKLTEEAIRQRNAETAGSLQIVNLREQIRVRDEALVQLSLRLSAYGDPGGPVIALAS